MRLARDGWLFCAPPLVIAAFLYAGCAGMLFGYDIGATSAAGDPATRTQDLLGSLGLTAVDPCALCPRHCIHS